MTTETAAKLWPIIKAYAEGAAIQATIDGGKTWHDSPNPWFQITYDSIPFRIKPIPREYWIKTNVCHGVFVEFTSNRPSNPEAWVHVKEVL